MVHDRNPLLPVKWRPKGSSRLQIVMHAGRKSTLFEYAVPDVDTICG
jgi:hypothetical protein